MMILSRKKGEGLVIGDCINVVVIEIRGDKVRLGIDAPSLAGETRSAAQGFQSRRLPNATHEHGPRSPAVTPSCCSLRSPSFLRIRSESKFVHS